MNNQVKLTDIKNDMLKAVQDAPFWTTFKVTMGYHLANTLATLLGIGLFVGLIVLIFRSLNV